MKRFPLVFLGLAVALAVYAYLLPLGEGRARPRASLIGQSLKKGPPGEGLRSPSLSDKGISEIDALLQEAVRQGTVPGVVAIVTNKDRVLYHGAFGLVDTGKRKPMQKDSIFRIASVNFQYTTSNTLRITPSSSPTVPGKPVVSGTLSTAGQASPTAPHLRERVCRSKRRLARQ